MPVSIFSKASLRRTNQKKTSAPGDAVTPSRIESSPGLQASFSRAFPPEILVEVAERLPASRDVLNFSLMAKPYFHFIYPLLFTNVELRSIDGCRERLSFLLAHPSYTRHIKKLILRPSYLRPLSSQALEDEEWVSNAVELMAPNMQALETFIWDGLEAPVDQIWLTLKNSCPSLNFIGSTVGSQPIKQTSHLFAFKDLVGFSLIPKHSTNELHQQYPRTICPLPPQFWEMLIENSPKLTYLALGAPNAPFWCQFLDGRSLTQGRWPHLQTLVLGRVLMHDDSHLMMPQGQDSDGEAEDSAPHDDRINGFRRWAQRRRTEQKFDAETRNWGSFLAYHLHRGLNSLALPYPHHYPDSPLSLMQTECEVPMHCLKSSECSARNTLQSFSGTLRYFLSFKPLFSCITDLDLCTEKHSPWMIPYIRRTLKTLPKLRSFGIWTDYSPDEYLASIETSEGLSELRSAGIQEEDRSELDFIQDIMKFCPKLMKLKVMSSTKSKHSLPMRSLHKPFLHNSSSLATLEVWKVHHLLDESMINTAARLSHNLPNLERISFRFSDKRWSEVRGISLRQSGNYEVIRQGGVVGALAEKVLDDDRPVPDNESERASFDSRCDLHTLALPATTAKAIALCADESGAGLFRMYAKRYSLNL